MAGVPVVGPRVSRGGVVGWEAGGGGAGGDGSLDASAGSLLRNLIGLIVLAWDDAASVADAPRDLEGRTWRESSRRAIKVIQTPSRITRLCHRRTSGRKWRVFPPLPFAGGLVLLRALSANFVRKLDATVPKTTRKLARKSGAKQATSPASCCLLRYGIAGTVTVGPGGSVWVETGRSVSIYKCILRLHMRGCSTKRKYRSPGGGQ